MKFLKNRTTVGILCIVLSLVVCFGITPLFNQSISQKTEIVRVAKQIKQGDEITKDMVQTVEVGSYNLPENILKTKETVIGTFATADFAVGDYILNTKVSNTPAYENAYLYNLGGTKQAISLTLKTFAGGLSGKLQSGDIVSVIAPDFREQGLTVIPPELKYVEVISVTAPSGYDANQRDAGPNSPSAEEKELPSTVTLLVTPEQGNILAELEAEGKSHLSLLFRGEKEQAQEFIAIQDEVIQKIYSPDMASESVATVTEPQSTKSEESHNSQTGESEGE